MFANYHVAVLTKPKKPSTQGVVRAVAGFLVNVTDGTHTREVRRKKRRKKKHVRAASWLDKGVNVTSAADSNERALK